MRVLLVTDNVEAGVVLSTIRAEGCKVEHARTGEDAFDLIRHYDFDLVVLTLQLPDMSGSDIIRRLRAARLDVPILACSLKDYAQPRVAALSAGADDVIALPVDASELIARMHAIVRRSRGHSQPLLQAGPVSLNLLTQEVRVNTNRVHLTPKETAVLRLLMLRRNAILTKEVFLDQIYNASTEEPEAKIIDVFICKIRKKFADAGAPDVIGTVWGRGYTIRDKGSDIRVTDQSTQGRLEAQRLEAAA